MKRIVLAAIIAALPSATVYSQTQSDKPAAAPVPAMKEEAKPAASAMKEEAKPAVPAMKEEAKPAAPQKDINIVQGPGQSAVREDARHCLELSSATDIIKCAEPYLPSRK